MVVVLFNAGDQLPVTPSSDTVVKADNDAPLHIGETELNVGMIGVLT